MSDDSMLEKTTRMNLLYDFYGTLLTSKQRSYMEMYYLEDLSLGEIAGQSNVSRQAVHDHLRRGAAQLLEYEQKLHLVERFEMRQRTLQETMAWLNQFSLPESVLLPLCERLALLAEEGEKEEI
ncbi:MAG: hypothetical protein JWN30_2499 [Bacilli bacterium]|nr:hypothetical protein [Bacilli bacterium]